MPGTTNIDELAAMLTEPYRHLELGQVNDHAVYLVRFKGSYPSHRHTKDEMYLVLEGEILIDYYDGPSVPLRKGESLVLRAGERHRSRAEKEALVLLFKAAHLFAE